jgi:hypothetical protein
MTGGDVRDVQRALRDVFRKAHTAHLCSATSQLVGQLSERGAKGLTQSSSRARPRGFGGWVGGEKRSCPASRRRRRLAARPMEAVRTCDMAVADRDAADYGEQSRSGVHLYMQSPCYRCAEVLASPV